MTGRWDSGAGQPEDAARRRNDSSIGAQWEWEQVDETAVHRDALLLEQLADGRRPSHRDRLSQHDDRLISLLCGWRDEARDARPHRVRKPSLHLGRRTAAAATVIVTSLSVSGVAAALGGLDPIGVLISNLPVVSSDRGGGEVSISRVDSLVRQAERALAQGDVRTSQALVERARELVEEVDRPAPAAMGRLAVLESKLAVAKRPAATDPVATQYGSAAATSGDMYGPGRSNSAVPGGNGEQHNRNPQSDQHPGIGHENDRAVGPPVQSTSSGTEPPTPASPQPTPSTSDLTSTPAASSSGPTPTPNPTTPDPEATVEVVDP